MKKTAAVITMVSLLCSLAVPFVSAKTEDDFLVYEVFDNYKTNDVPEVGKHSLNEQSRVIEDDNNNKVFYLGGILDNTVGYTFSKAESELVIDFELEFLTNNAAADVCVTTQSGSRLKLLSFGIGGGAKTWDGYNTKISAIGRKQRITLITNAKTQSYTVRCNNRIITENWRCSSLSQSISGFSLNIYGDGTGYEAVVDNVYVYSGNDLYNDNEFPVVSFNSASIDYKEPDADSDEIGNEVFVNEDFENAETGGTISVSGMSLNNKGNPMTIEYDRGRKSSYLRFQGFTGDPHIDVGFSNPVKHMVFEYDIKSDNFTGSGPFMLIRNAAGTSFNSFTMSQGTIKYPDGSTLVSLQKGIWHHIAVAYDFSAKTYDVYLDNELKRENIPFGNKDVSEIALERMHISSCGASGSEYCLDNFRVYEATAPREDSETEIAGSASDGSVFGSDADVKASLDGSAALVIGRKLMWAENKKISLDAAPKLIGDVTYVPVRAVSEAFETDVVWDGDKQQVTLGNSVVTIGSTKAEINGEVTELSAAPVIENERCLMPLRAISEQILGKKVFWNDGLIIISDSEYDHQDDIEFLDKTKEFVKYYRPTADEIKSDFEANGKGVHPRILMTQDNVNNIKKYISAGDETVKKYYDTIIAKADEYLTADTLEYVLPDGYRLLGTSQEMLQRMRALGFAWLLTGDSKYPEKAWIDLKAVCNFANWNYRHHLDVGEMTTAVAVGYDWMYDYWTKSQKKLMVEAMYEKSLSTYYAKFMNRGTPVTFQSWTNATNWNTVCNGGTIVGALACAEDYPDLCYDLISKCIRSTEIFWNAFGAEGSWPEGPGYLTYAVEYMDFMISSMNASLNTSYGLLDMGEIGGIGDFYAHTDGYVGANNYQDMGAGHQYVQYLYWLASARDEPALGQIQTKLEYSLTSDLSALQCIDCILWYKPEYRDTSKISFPLDYKFTTAELFCSRTSWTGNDGVYLSAHGGSNDDNHWHADAGTFVIDAMGERWAIDHGPDNYNAKEGYFSGNRYKFYRVRVEGHNCVVINPDEGLGQEWTCFCPITRFESSERSSIAVIDLNDAYRTQTDSYQRGYMLADNRRTVTVRDEIVLKSPGELYWFMQTSADVEIENPKKAILTIGFKKMIMELESDAPYEFYVDETVPLETSPNAEGQTLPGKKRITIKYTGVDKVNITVKFTPQDSYGITPELDAKPISEWKLEEGSYKELPKLDMIYIDGEPIYDFDPQNTNYKITAPKSLTDIPVVTADAPAGVGYEIEQSTEIGTPSRIKVYYLASPNDAQYYSIGYVLLPDLPDLNGKKRYQALSLTVSSEPQPDNTRENAFNGIIGDRWAADGTDEWMIIDLGEEKQIGQIGTAFISGDARIASYGYSVSNDGINFESVFDGKSSGKTTDFEFIDVNRTARYVRFEGHGNTVNTWNSISEIAILAP